MIREQAQNSSDSRGRAMDQHLVEVSKCTTSGVDAEKVNGFLLTSIYQRQTVSFDIKPTEFIELREIRSCRNGVVFSRWECPSAPLLTAS
jgi:hypothetical protein